MTAAALSDEVDRKHARRRLVQAVRRNRMLSRAGIGERLFARLFTGLVYTQIWEDPEVDMAALAIEPGHTIVTIASGGCNALSYLLADPARIEAVDLNPAHVAYNRLKIAALTALPDHQSFYRFYGDGDDPANLDTYRTVLRPHLDRATLAYWEGRDRLGRKRISIFAKNPYRHGLLGLFIGAGHVAARLHGVDPKAFLATRSMGDQRAFFDQYLSPLFERRLIRWASARKSTLFGLGIPPQQYDALVGAGEDGMAAVLKQRLEKLACHFPLSDNYFAWQAFGRGYGKGGPLPPYLQAGNFETLRARADRLTVVNASFTELLAAKPDRSVDRFILLDAQDWMNDGQLNELWSQITRTAAPGARVIFRTAAAESLLPGRVDEIVLRRWDYRTEESRTCHGRDRSSIYGGFHLYVLKETAS